MNSDIPEEQIFRQRYSSQLRSFKSMRQLEEELRYVCHQEMMTPGRRGEEIKQEELGSEIARRYFARS